MNCLDRSGELPTVRGPTPSVEKSHQFSLVVVEGPDAGLVYSLDPTSPARVLVGKSPLCACRLTDDQVSRRHASFRASGGALVVTDLGSTNGTTVNGVAVREAALGGGEAIRIGRTVISVVRGARAEVTLPAETSFGRILGASSAMRRLYPVFHALAAKNVAVLVEGEPGVGKQLCAEELHRHSGRPGPFVEVSCQALAPEELEDHFLAENGLLRNCEAGSIFIDELTALSLRTQRALARCIERPSSRSPRLFFATTRDVDAEQAQGRALEELLARLAPTRIELPPLRHRDRDALLLARAFWRALATSDEARECEPLPTDFAARFQNYPWPGNVRELSRAVAVRFNQGAFGRWRSPDSSVRGADFVTAVVEQERPFSQAREVVVDEFEQRYVRHMLERYGNTRDAARASGVTVRYFQLLRARWDD